MSELIESLAREFEDKEYAHVYLQENSNLRIAAQIRALRLHRKWSQAELASRAKMHQERISKIEMADFDSLSMKTLRRLAEAFDVHLSIRFSSVGGALLDFALLSPERLICDDRALSLAKVQDRTQRNLVTIAATQSHTNLIPIGASLSSTKQEYAVLG